MTKKVFTFRKFFGMIIYVKGRNEPLNFTHLTNFIEN